MIRSPKDGIYCNDTYVFSHSQPFRARNPMRSRLERLFHSLSGYLALPPEWHPVVDHGFSNNKYWCHINKSGGIR